MHDGCQLVRRPDFVPTTISRFRSPLVLMGSTKLEGSLYVPPVPTKPEPFVFVTDDRGERRRPKAADREEHASGSAFRAYPLDRSILEGPVRGG